MRAPTKFPSHHAIALATLAALTLPHSGARAQASTPTLQTITITAERREENIKDVPNSVSTLAGEFLDVLSLSLDEALAAVKSGEITDAKTITGLFWAEKALLAGW